MGLALFTAGFIIVASLVFAALSVSPMALWTFPIVVSLWTAFLWVLIARAIASFSTRPHRPGRVTAIILGGCVLALAALAASILGGLVVLRFRF